MGKKFAMYMEKKFVMNISEVQKVMVGKRIF